YQNLLDHSNIHSFPTRRSSDLAYLEYIRNKSPANKAASSPPAAARISTITFLSSLGSFGISKNLISSSNFSFRSVNSSISIFTISTISSSESNSSISLASANSSVTVLYFLYAVTESAKPACSLEYSRSLSGSLPISGSLNNSFNFSYLSSNDFNHSNILYHS